MRDMLTNFALLMELARVDPEKLSRALETDPSLISRWRTGSRRPNARWRRKLADYFLDACGNEVRTLLAEAVPLGLAQGIPPLQLLEQWLGETGGSWEHREELLFLCRSGRLRRKNQARPQHLLGAGMRSGDAVVRNLLGEFLDYALTQTGSGRILFACPEGLELFTRDEGYNLPLQEQLRQVLERGKQLQVVLRTDYRPSDVASACGPWLWAHLMGYIQSYYYDDFRLLEHEKILIGLRGRLMIQVRVEDNGPTAIIRTDPAGVAEVEAHFDACLKRSRQRFRYNFFSEPQDFLRGAVYNREKPMSLIHALPDLGIRWETVALRLEPCELALLQRQFGLLTISLWEIDKEAEVRHIFCAESIDETLDNARHLCRPLSAVCKRRIYLDTQELVDQLAAIRRALEQRPQYKVCFIPREWFVRIRMEIVVWGNEAAVAWIAARQSAACRDYPNVAALHGFCATVWEMIPPSHRNRRAAENRLDRWLERARRFGFRIGL